MKDELGTTYGTGNTANEAFDNLLNTLAGKVVTATIFKRTYTFKIPKNLTAQEAK